MVIKKYNHKEVYERKVDKNDAKKELTRLEVIQRVNNKTNVKALSILFDNNFISLHSNYYYRLPFFYKILFANSI